MIPTEPGVRRTVMPSVLWSLAVLGFVCGLVLVGVVQWSQPLEEGERALRQGNLDAALAHYAASEARFDRLPLTRQIMPRAYLGSISNQLWAQYQLNQYDAIIEKAAVSPTSAATHFWAGCALFQKGTKEEDPQARIGWLNRAEGEFRSALELEPADWDTKFNYELTRRLLLQLQKQPKTPPSQLLQLLRPEPKAGAQPGKRVG
jgi:hypothetical protein